MWKIHSICPLFDNLLSFSWIWKKQLYCFLGLTQRASSAIDEQLFSGCGRSALSDKVSVVLLWMWTLCSIRQGLSGSSLDVDALLYQTRSPWFFCPKNPLHSAFHPSLAQLLTPFLTLILPFPECHATGIHPTLFSVAVTQSIVKHNLGSSLLQMMAYNPSWREVRVILTGT